MGTKHLSKHDLELEQFNTKPNVKKVTKNESQIEATFCHLQFSSHVRKERGRKLILPSLSYVHDFSQRNCNISILVSVSLCMFTMLKLWRKATCYPQAT